MTGILKAHFIVPL